MYVCIYHPYVCIYDTYIHTSIICSAYNIALIYTCVIFRFFLQKSDVTIFLLHKEMHPVSSGTGHVQWQLGAPVSLPCSLHPCSSWNLHEGSQVVERGEPWNQQNRNFLNHGMVLSTNRDVWTMLNQVLILFFYQPFKTFKVFEPNFEVYIWGDKFTFETFFFWKTNRDWTFFFARWKMVKNHETWRFWNTNSDLARKWTVPFCGKPYGHGFGSKTNWERLVPKFVSTITFTYEECDAHFWTNQDLSIWQWSIF